MRKYIALIILLQLAATGLYAQTTKIPDFPDTGEEISSYPAVEWLKGSHNCEML